MIIRPASHEDLAALSAIYDHEVRHGTSTFDTEPRTPQARESWFASHRTAAHPLLVAVVEPAGVIAWGSLSSWSPRGAYAKTVEASVFVHPRHRREGAGRAVLAALVEAAQASRHRVILGRIEAGNEASRKLLHRSGFTSIGVMHAVGEKFGRVLDVELFERVL